MNDKPLGVPLNASINCPIQNVEDDEGDWKNDAENLVNLRRGIFIAVRGNVADVREYYGE